MTPVLNAHLLSKVQPNEAQTCFQLETWFCLSLRRYAPATGVGYRDIGFIHSAVRAVQVETHQVDPGLKASALGLKPVESTSPFKVPVSDGSTCTPYSTVIAGAPPGRVWQTMLLPRQHIYNFKQLKIRGVLSCVSDDVASTHIIPSSRVQYNSRYEGS